MVQPVGLFDCMDLATPTVGPHALVRHSPRNRDLARHSSTTTEPLATGTFTQCYKLADDKIRAVIGQKSGQSSKFDIMQDQSTRDRRYQNANLEYGCRSLPTLSLPALFLWNGGSSSHSHVCFHPVAGCVRVGFVKSTCTRSMVGLRRNTSSASDVRALSHSPLARSRQVQRHARLHGALALYALEGEPPSSSPRAMATPCY